MSGLAILSPAHAQTGRANPSVVVHTVELGDTVFIIAQRYGSSVDRILRANHIPDVRLLYVGTALRVPLIPGRKPDPSFASHAGESIDELLARSERELREARFDQALARALEIEPLLARLPTDTAAPRRARLEVVRGTALVALGQNLEALESFEKALRADPLLELDPATVSPKVMNVFTTAQRGIAYEQ